MDKRLGVVGITRLAPRASHAREAFPCGFSGFRHSPVAVCRPRKGDFRNPVTPLLSPGLLVFQWRAEPHAHRIDYGQAPRQLRNESRRFEKPVEHSRNLRCGSRVRQAQNQQAEMPARRVAAYIGEIEIARDEHRRMRARELRNLFVRRGAQTDIARQLRAMPVRGQYRQRRTRHIRVERKVHAAGNK